MTGTSAPKKSATRSRRWILVVSAAVVTATFVVLLIVAAGRAQQTQALAAGSTSTVVGSGAGSSLALRTVSGKTVRVSDGRPAVLFFFTGECSACIIGAKNLEAVPTNIGKGFDIVFVGVDPTEPADTLTAFLASVGNPSFPVVRDDGSLLRRFSVEALGTTVVLDAVGREIFRAVDPSPEQTRQALETASAT